MATPTELTRAHRALQTRRAGLVGLLVARYFATRVNVDDPTSIDRWLEIMIPRILAERDTSAGTAVAYANEVRRLEVPASKEAFRFEKAEQISPDAIRTSLRVVGSGEVARKYREIRETDADPGVKQAEMREARAVAEVRIAGAVSRHVQNGGRQSLLDGVLRDPVALGYIRVTKDDPCYFCALLASRGLVYSEDSFDESDARFTGSGTVKVHDTCGCSLKPAYRRDDEMLEQSKEFFDLYRQARAESTDRGILITFRQLYEGREVK